MGREFIVDETLEAVSEDEKKRKDRERNDQPFTGYVNCQGDFTLEEVKRRLINGDSDRFVFVKAENGYKGHRFLISGDVGIDRLDEFSDGKLSEEGYVPKKETITEEIILIKDTSKHFHELSLKSDLEKDVTGFLCSSRTALDDLIQTINQKN